MMVDEAKFIHELTKQESWGLGLDDVSIVLELTPDHSVVAELDGRIVGGITVAVNGPDATLGQVIVDSEHRGSGIGRSMLAAVLKRLDGEGVRKVELMGMEGTDRFYGSFGFRPIEDITMVNGTPAREPSEEMDGFELRPIEDEVDMLEGLVSKTIGHDRWPYAKAFMERAPELALGLFEDDSLRGYLQGRSSAAGGDLGPWVIEHPTEALAEYMLSGILNRIGQAEIYGFVPSSQDISLGLLKRRGMSKSIEMKRFVRARETATSSFPRTVLAVCSAEFV